MCGKKNLRADRESKKYHSTFEEWRKRWWPVVAAFKGGFLSFHKMLLITYPEKKEEREHLLLTANI